MTGTPIYNFLSSSLSKVEKPRYLFPETFPLFGSFYSLFMRGIVTKLGNWERSRGYYASEIFVVSMVRRGEIPRGFLVRENYHFY